MRTLRSLAGAAAGGAAGGRPRQAGVAQGVELRQLPAAPEPAGRKLAYVMMAYDPPNAPPGESLWGAMAMARALQRLSQYPMVLLTNTTSLPDGTDLASALTKLNVKLQPVERVDIPGAQGWTFERWNVAFWKLQVFRMTEWEKIIWLDSDSIAYRSLDWMFDRPGMWAQRDDWFCNLKQTRVCSGIMSLVPRESDFDGLLQYAAQVGGTLERGDQQLISQYFEEVAKDPIHLLDDVDATFGQCMGTAPPEYMSFDAPPPQGSWSTPAFIHKSGGWGDTNNNVYSNVCFSHNVTRQRFVMPEGVNLNVCHFHPLGAYWRTLFCEATQLLGITMPEVTRYCDDTCYYKGTNSDGGSCEPFQEYQLVAPLNATTGRRDSPKMIPALAPNGLPAPEALQAAASIGEDAKGLVRYNSFSMREWNCAGRCPGGGCCNDQDCAWQCLENPEVKDTCHSYRWTEQEYTCELFSRLEAKYSSVGGHSGGDFDSSFIYQGAPMPEPPFTITVKIRTTVVDFCQEVIGWGDGQGTWKSAELRLEQGEIVYGENPTLPDDPTANEWGSVQSAGLNLADGLWHSLAVVRKPTGEVQLYADGSLVGHGFIAKAIPTDLVPVARTARVSHMQDCVFNGDVAHLRIFTFPLSPSTLHAIA